MFDLEPPPEAYVVECRAIVVGADQEQLVLSRSPFAPAIPGRASDVGHVDDVPIERVVGDGDGTLLHIVDPAATPHRFAPGQEVTPRIDWDRRFAMMRLHTAQHLAYLGFETIHGPAKRHDRMVEHDRAYVDIEPTRALPDGVVGYAIASWMERVVADDLLISSLAHPTEPARRYWYVDGVGSVACTGLHPESTGAVGPFDLEVEEGGRGDIRLTVRLKLR